MFCGALTEQGRRSAIWPTDNGHGGDPDQPLVRRIDRSRTPTVFAVRGLSAKAALRLNARRVTPSPRRGDALPFGCSKILGSLNLRARDETTRKLA
jgi:hypothetical protein